MQEIAKLLKRFQGTFDLESDWVEKRRDRLRRAYGFGLDENVVGIYDTTTSQNGTRGILFTEKALYWNAFEDARQRRKPDRSFISYEELCRSKVFIRSEGSALIINIESQHRTPDHCLHEIRICKKGPNPEIGLAESLRNIREFGEGLPSV